MELRYYQENAVNAPLLFWQSNKDASPLIVLPTGTGKSLVQAKFITKCLEMRPASRFVCATHVSELVEQNYLEYLGIAGVFGRAGIYSAGIGRRESQAQVLFCGIQSVYLKAEEIGHCDCLIIDEAHTIPKDGDGRWLRFIQDMKKINPHMKILGLTATPYRMTGGHLTDGENRIFTDVCYEYSIESAFKDGYLSPLVAPPRKLRGEYDMSKLKKNGNGDYTDNSLNSVFNVDSATEQTLDELMFFGADRKSWLLFAASVDHAFKIEAGLIKRGISCAVVTGETASSERDTATESIKNGNIRALINCKVFTTGFNAKNIDLIADWGKTASVGLYVQKLGRGTRTAPDKSDCLLLDFAGNVDQHGAIDKVKAPRATGGNGDAPMKVCEKCLQVLYAGVRVCPSCGFQFPWSTGEFHNSASHSAPVSFMSEPEDHIVTGWFWSVHEKRGAKEGDKPTMRVDYFTQGGMDKFCEFVCFEHTGFALGKARGWWRDHVPDYAAYPPESVAEAVKLFGDPSIRVPVRLTVRKEGKYWRIIGKEFNDADGLNAGIGLNGGFKGIEDEIPF